MRQSGKDTESRKKLLLITYVFAPLSVVGIFRPLRIAKYLPRFEWDVDVLTAYPRTDVLHDKELIKEIPDSVAVHRIKRWDPWSLVNKPNRYVAASTSSNGSRPVQQVTHDKEKKPSLKDRMKAVVSRFRQMMRHMFSTPDTQVFWVPFATLKGIRLNRLNRYDAILTTSPPHSCHLIGWLLSRILRKP